MNGYGSTKTVLLQFKAKEEFQIIRNNNKIHLLITNIRLRLTDYYRLNGKFPNTVLLSNTMYYLVISDRRCKTRLDNLKLSIENGKFSELNHFEFSDTVVELYSSEDFLFAGNLTDEPTFIPRKP